MEARPDCERTCEPTSGPAGCHNQADCRFAEQLARLIPLKVRFLRSRGLDESTAEDLVSRAVVSLLGVSSRIEHLAAYFHMMVVREHLDLLREIERQRRYAPRLAAPDVSDDNVHSFLEYQERLAALRALKGISERAVLIAELRFVLGWSTEDIMAHTKMSRDAIDQQVSRLRKAALRAMEQGEF